MKAATTTNNATPVDPPLWHTRSAEWCFKELRSSPQGLTDAEVEKRHASHGYNRLPLKAKKPAIVRFLLQVRVDIFIVTFYISCIVS